MKTSRTGDRDARPGYSRLTASTKEQAREPAAITAPPTWKIITRLRVTRGQAASKLQQEGRQRRCTGQTGTADGISTKQADDREKQTKRTNLVRLLLEDAGCPLTGGRALGWRRLTGTRKFLSVLCTTASTRPRRHAWVMDRHSTAHCGRSCQLGGATKRKKQENELSQPVDRRSGKLNMTLGHLSLLTSNIQRPANRGPAEGP